MSDNKLLKFPANADYEILASPSGRVIYTTAALRTLLDEDICGRNLNDLLPDEQVAGLIAAGAGGKSYKFNGKLCSVAVTCEMKPCEGDLLISVTPTAPSGVASITPATAELLSRELNMNAATMFVTLENYRNKLSEQDRETPELAIVTRGIYQMMRLSRNMLDTALFESGKMVLHKRYGDLNKLCQKIADESKIACEALGIGFEFITTDENMMFRFDEERVERVIMNLLCNSMQYTRDGNIITLKLSKKDNFATITVADKGVGISAVALADVFSKHAFADASSPNSLGGAGFGFGLAKAVSHMHDGSCFVTSSVNVGTLVTFSIPCDGIDTGFASPKPPDYAGEKSHILLELSSVLPPKFYEKG